MGFKQRTVYVSHNIQVFDIVSKVQQNMQRRMSAEQDLQLQRAIKEIPQAAQLAERARKQVRK